MLMLMFRSVSKNTFFENRLNDGGVNFMNALNNITKKICRCSKADSFTFLITAETGMHMTYQQLFICKFYIKSNYKIAHTLFLAFRKQNSLKFDLLGVIGGCGFPNSDVTRFQTFSQTMSYKYIMA